ncbi:proprotein convertase subtilisin/kexin type 4-like [Mercenaria mercenaria]|uniref:proprotein convertase subtilisin/kexin type 4-like n=1 Tax=Mercenaria mercenaria TaxID=6596 RepID=UPI00234EDC2D|nr:proprotein convertase subtilisin/kexin type 4-like [Mercenaria mercenaria]
MPWSLLKPFDELDLATREALIFGAEKGRRGLGRIYVVPAGPNGNEVTNNIFTITVNGIGREGIVPENTFADTSVLVSGLSEGHNLTSRYMITTTQKNACSDLFRGVSAAASQVAAIIGLALQAYPSLTLRDIQHLIVQSSEYDELDEKHAFICNGAGRYYHRYFGFGLLNATKLVTLAKKQTKTLKLLSVKLENSTEKISDDGLVFQCEFCQGCDDASTQPCLTKIEHVAVSFEFETQTKELRMYLTSPSGTESVLMKDTKDLKSKTIGQIVSVNFWDEMALGLWTFRLYSIPSLKDEDNVTTNVTSVTLTLYGTSATIPSEKQNRCDSSRPFSDDNDISETDDLEEQSDESHLATIIERLKHLAINFVVISGLVCLAKCLARF